MVSFAGLKHSRLLLALASILFVNSTFGPLPGLALTNYQSPQSLTPLQLEIEKQKVRLNHRQKES